MNYSDWLTAVTTLMNIADTDGVAAFTALAPRCIDYVELRLERDPDLDFPALRVSDASQVTTAGVRTVPIPPSVSVAGFAGTLRVIEGVNLILPAAAQNQTLSPSAAGAQRMPLLPTSRPFIDIAWSIESQPQAPVPYETYYATFSQDVAAPSDPTEPSPGTPSGIIIAPTVDDRYSVEFTGTGRLAPLSATNVANFYTLYVPDLYVALSCVWICGYQRDFSPTGNTPGMAEFWEGQYTILKGGAAVQTARQRMFSDGTTSLPPTPPGALSRGIMPAGAPPPPPGAMPMAAA